MSPYRWRIVNAEVVRRLRHCERREAIRYIACLSGLLWAIAHTKTVQ
ncbi:MAG: hypothetical protein LBE79_09105 [Tannerella sp.]|nr:hypothetical protein [Tannerella sp.]